MGTLSKEMIAYIRDIDLVAILGNQQNTDELSELLKKESH